MEISNIKFCSNNVITNSSQGGIESSKLKLIAIHPKNIDELIDCVATYPAQIEELSIEQSSDNSYQVHYCIAGKRGSLAVGSSLGVERLRLAMRRMGISNKYFEVTPNKFLKFIKDFVLVGAIPVVGLAMFHGGNLVMPEVARRVDMHNFRRELPKELMKAGELFKIMQADGSFTPLSLINKRIVGVDEITAFAESAHHYIQEFKRTGRRRSVSEKQLGIVITGIPGTGKSVLVDNLAYELAAADKHSTIFTLGQSSRLGRFKLSINEQAVQMLEHCKQHGIKRLILRMHDPHHSVAKDAFYLIKELQDLSGRYGVEINVGVAMNSTLDQMGFNQQESGAFFRRVSGGIVSIWKLNTRAVLEHLAPKIWGYNGGFTDSFVDKFGEQTFGLGYKHLDQLMMELKSIVGKQGKDLIEQINKDLDADDWQKNKVLSHMINYQANAAPADLKGVGATYKYIEDHRKQAKEQKEEKARKEEESERMIKEAREREVQALEIQKQNAERATAEYVTRNQQQILMMNYLDRIASALEGSSSP